MKYFSTEHKMLAVILFCSLAASLFAACTLPAGNTPATTSAATTSAATTSSESSVAETISTIEISIDYDEEDAEIISLNGDSASSDSDSVAIDGSVITIKSKGTYKISGTLNDGYIVVDAGDSDDVTLVFDGASITSSDYAALYCLNADNVYIILEDGTENLLANKGSFDSKDDNSVDGAIFAKTDITINGTGSLKVESEDHGIVGKDDVAIAGGTIEINAASDGIQANDSVVIQEAVINIYCGKDGIQSDNEDQAKGYVYISSGEITIEAGDDGITASSSLQIDGGIVDIVDSYEGLEGQNIVLNGGTITVSSSDDAINAVSASSSGEMFGDDGSTLVINGGEIYLMTGGDGVDSNGTFDMTGGYLVVMGPEIGANGSLDVNGSATITGGTVIMAGASGMATNFTSATQGTVLLTVGNQTEGSEIKVTDSSGNVILSADSVSSYQTILVSSPDMTKGSSYTITAGNYEETITLEEYIYGSGMEFGGPGGGGGPGF